MRQYIGARYVPVLFNNNGSAEWIANTSYEALTIVTFNNASYTSVKNVPPTIGNPAQNADYWVLTANYNAAFNELQNAFTRTVNELNENYNEFKTLVESRERFSSSKKNYSFLLIGDSYGYDASASGRRGWIMPFKGLCNAYGIKCDGQGYGGYGIYTNQGNDFISILDNYDLTKYTHVIILGGANDYNNQEKLQENLLNINKKVKNAGALFIYGFIGHIVSNPTTCFNIRNLYNTEMGICNIIGVPFIREAYAWLANKLFFMEDNVHPKTSATNNLAFWLFNLLMGGSNQCRILTPTSGFGIEINGDIMFIKMYNEINVNYTVDSTKVTTVPLYDLNSLPEWYMMGNNFSAPCNGIVIINGRVENVGMNIIFNTNGISAQILTPFTNGEIITKIRPYLNFSSHFSYFI